MGKAPFPPRGLVYFWFLNDDCRLGHLRRQIRAFAQARVGAVVLHPRAGLLLPYGGSDWFDLVRAVVEECVREKVQPWLYDEDPYPSGNAGGRVLTEYPELAARGIVRFEAPQGKAGELFVFPTGKLLWAGLLPADGRHGSSVDLTDKVGIIRKHWEVSPWDSRWYYPATPLYECPRSEAYFPELALRRPKLPRGWKLVAFVAQPVGHGSVFGGLIDSLNARATALYLERTHERYADSLGDLLGREIPAIFTDEPKWYAPHPWTPGLFEDFQKKYDYDLHSKLEHLFSNGEDSEAMLTRLHYREWCRQRFEDAWLRPVSQWCKKHSLALVGHISPEDDPVQQVACVGNLFPLHRHFNLVGLDLIIPALGDACHPLLNIGVTSAVSAAQQMNKAGVMSESLACSGEEFEPSAAARILAWQVASGVSTIVVHGAFSSTLGLRRFDAPPDFGPQSVRWKGMLKVDRGLRPFFEFLRGSTQLAPVAILWPIRSFNAKSETWHQEDSGPRRDLSKLLLSCLESQTGVHLLDEAALVSARFEGKRLRLGRARYEMLLLPSLTVLNAETMEKLRALREAAFPVYAVGEQARWVQQSRCLEQIKERPWLAVDARRLRSWVLTHLPRLLPLGRRSFPDLRVTGWRKDGRTVYVVMNIGETSQALPLGDQVPRIEAGNLVALAETAGNWSVGAHFKPCAVGPAGRTAGQPECGRWEVRWPGEDWQPLDRPVAVYQLRPRWQNPDALVLLTLMDVSTSGGLRAAEQVDYRCELRIARPHRSSVLILEPTAIRGRFTITVARRSWAVRIQDTDIRPTELDLSAALRRGPNRIRFRLHHPTPFDGIKISPRIRLG